MPSRIGERIATVVADRTVTAEEAQSLVDEARTGRYTPDVRADLTALVARRGDTFAPGARQTVSAFLRANTPARDLSDPSLPDRHLGSMTWVPADPSGRLYVDGISKEDVQQGSLGDCYLVASLASLAHAQPQALRNAIRENADGTYTVRLFIRERDGGPLVARNFTVDSDIPSSDGRSSRMGRSTDDSERWVGIIEKAYAQRYGGYRQIENRFSSEVFEAITGKQAEHFNTSWQGTDRIFDALTRASTGGRGATASSYSEGANTNFGPVDLDASGIIGNHQYSVLGTGTENGERFVELRNPWGQRDRSGGEAVFRLPWSEFLKTFSIVNIAG